MHIIQVVTSCFNIYLILTILTQTPEKVVTSGSENEREGTGPLSSH